MQCLCRWLTSTDFVASCFTGPPALTVNITKNTDSLSIVVQWDEVDDSITTTYVVTWTSERGHIKKSPGLVGLTSHTITGLTLDIVYNITVTATNICGSAPEYTGNVTLSASANPSIVNTSAITNFTATNIITHPTSTINPTDTTTADESSKFSSNSICYN